MLTAPSNFPTALGIIGSIVTLVSFVFALWVWMRMDAKVKGANLSLHAIQDVVDGIVLDDDGFHADDVGTLQRRLASMRGAVYGIRGVTSAALDTQHASLQPEVRTLMSKRLLWTSQMLWDRESSDDLKTIWILTPDLYPDAADPHAAAVVRQNLKRGVRYFYFVPPSLAADAEVTERLYTNLKQGRFRRSIAASGVTIVPFTRAQLLSNGANCVVYFKGTAKAGTGVGYHEILLSGLTHRGAFWRELDAPERDELIRALLESLRERVDVAR
jgi:hypothetical protein